MAVELNPTNILQIAKIAQYLAANSVSDSNNFKGKSVDESVAIVIYMERIGIQKVYDQNPNDPTLQATSNYLYALLGRYGILALARLQSLQVAPPTIIGPNDQTVNVGANASFFASVQSSVAFTVQWYDSNNQPIAGAISQTYIFPNAQVSDNNKTFYMKATNSAGVATSRTAVLVVAVQPQVNAWYGTVDPFPALNGGTDNLAYQVTQNIVSGQPYTINWPAAAANNQFEVIREDTSEPLKTTWFNTNQNNGTIPDSAFRDAITIGTKRYYISRTAISLDGTTLTEKFS